MNYDPFNDRQGRDGMHSVNASRAALGLDPLHRDEAEHDDPPLYTVGEVTDLLPGWLAFILFCVAALCMAIACM